MAETFLWCEQYRPKDVKSCILPENLKNTFSEFIQNGQIPNLILTGGSGVGKTTVAKAMLEGRDYVAVKEVAQTDAQGNTVFVENQ